MKSFYISFDKIKALKTTAILILLLILLSFSACSMDTRFDSEFFAMDTVMTITAFGGNSEAAVKSAEAEINRLDSVFSIQNKNSDIYKLNKSKTITASKETLELFNLAFDVNSMTDGAFDITTEPFTRAWGFYSGLENNIPSEEQISILLDYVGIKHINIDGSMISIDKNTSVDLGGIVKGYSSSAAAKILKDKGVSSALLSLGGNVRAIGNKPDGTGWNVAIADPNDKSKQIGTVTVSDKAVVTSGGYQRYFEKNGKIYHHIIDPSTGCPAESGLKSVTVISDDDALADALSTALFVMGLEKSSDLYKSNSSVFDAVFVTDDNNIYITENITDIFTSQHEFKVVHS